jgi:hypothetical protein
MRSIRKPAFRPTKGWHAVDSTASLSPDERLACDRTKGLLYVKQNASISSDDIEARIYYCMVEIDFRVRDAGTKNFLPLRV